MLWRPSVQSIKAGREAQFVRGDKIGSTHTPLHSIPPGEDINIYYCIAKEFCRYQKLISHEVMNPATNILAPEDVEFVEQIRSIAQALAAALEELSSKTLLGAMRELHKDVPNDSRSQGGREAGGPTSFIQGSIPALYLICGTSQARRSVHTEKPVRYMPFKCISDVQHILL